MNKKTLALTLVLALPASLTLAQRPGGGGPPPGPPPNQQPGGEPRGSRPPKREREPRGKPPLDPLPLPRVLDADHDGIIAAGEIEKAPEALRSLDKNQDGKLTPNEFLAPRPDGPTQREPGDKEREWPFPGRKPPGDAEKENRAPKRAAADNGGERPAPKPPGDREKKGGEGERPPAPPLVAALDADHNGEISAGEIADAAKSLLTLDKNGDGQLGPREFLGPPPGERPDGNGPKPPRPPQEPE